MGPDGDGHMSERETDLDALLTGLEPGNWVDTTPADAGTNVGAVFVFCSMTRVGHDPALWPADGVGTASTLGTVGNQVWKPVDDGTPGGTARATRRLSHGRRPCGRRRRDHGPPDRPVSTRRVQRRSAGRVSGPGTARPDHRGRVRPRRGRCVRLLPAEPLPRDRRRRHRPGDTPFAAPRRCSRARRERPRLSATDGTTM